MEGPYSWDGLIDQLMIRMGKCFIDPGIESVQVGVFRMHRTMAFCDAAPHCHHFDWLSCERRPGRRVSAHCQVLALGNRRFK